MKVLFATTLFVGIISFVRAYHITPTASITRAGRSSQSLYSLKIRSSSFFGIGAIRRSLQVVPSNSLRLTSIPNGENTAEAEAKTIQTDNETSNDTNSSSSSIPSTSLLQSIDKLGMKLKPLALTAHDKSTQIKSTNVNGQQASQGSMLKSTIYSIKSNILWMLYIIYRGYRGFFVILPAVFKEVFRQLEESNIAMDAFGDENNQASTTEQQQSMRLRTRITVSILSSILTLSYVVSGLLRVLGKPFNAFCSCLQYSFVQWSTSLPDSGSLYRQIYENLYHNNVSRVIAACGSR